MRGEEAVKNVVDDIIAKRKPREAKKKTGESKVIRANVEYTYWTGTRNHPVPHKTQEVVTWTDGEKLVKTKTGMKRLSSLKVSHKS